MLQFTDGSGTPIWSRWSQVFDGLHLLNGFQTTAQCVDVTGGTAGEFSSWLLGKNFGFFTFPALRVRPAWAMMALGLEPAGKQYVTMGVYGSGGVTTTTTTSGAWARSGRTSPRARSPATGG